MVNSYTNKHFRSEFCRSYLPQPFLLVAVFPMLSTLSYAVTGNVEIVDFYIMVNEKITALDLNLVSKEIIHWSYSQYTESKS